MFNPSFLSRFGSLQITLCVILLMILAYWIGHLIMRARKRKGIEDHAVGVVEGSLLGLLALILGFTFSMSDSRYERRIALTVEEGNAIGTAILRADLYPDSIRNILRTEFSRYLEARIDFVQSGTDLRKIYVTLDSATAIQARLWSIVTRAAQDKENYSRTNQMVPALNQMIDIVSTRNASLVAKVPDLILFLLFGLCCTGAFMLGYSSSNRPEWAIVTSFLVMVGLSIYMIIDLDRPRTGIINNKEMQYFITSLRSMFTNP
jgi:hypothetical protein